jgi:hypothetical protein
MHSTALAQQSSNVRQLSSTGIVTSAASRVSSPPFPGGFFSFFDPLFPLKNTKIYGSGGTGYLRNGKKKGIMTLSQFMST